MKSRCIAIAILLTGVLANFAYAATATGNLTVSANVVQACMITSVSDINFGDYNPSSGTPKDSQGSFSFLCLGGTNYELYITGERLMSDSASNKLNYELYTDAGRTNIWPSAVPSSENGVTIDANPVTREVYGRIPPYQYRPAGSYTNMVLIAVDF